MIYILILSFLLLPDCKHLFYLCNLSYDLIIVTLLKHMCIDHGTQILDGKPEV